MKADDKTEAAVMAVVNKWLESYTARDIDAIMAFYAPDPGVVLIGTGADERCVGLAEIKALHEREWSQSEAGSFELRWYAVSAAGSVAWVATDVIVHVRVEGQEMHLPGRITAVLEQRGDTWLFLQLHGSLPATGQDEGQAWPTLPTAGGAEGEARPTLAGTWEYLLDDREGMSICTDTHYLWILVSKERESFQGDRPTEAEKASAFSSAYAEGGTYAYSGPTRVTHHRLFCTNPNLVGTEFSADNEFDGDLLRMWHLNPDGSRRAMVGMARRLKASTT